MGKDDDDELRRWIAEAFGEEMEKSQRIAALHRLLTRLEPRVNTAVARALTKYRAAYYYRGGVASKDDVTSRVFEALWRNDGKALLAWRPNEPFSPYLQKIAINATCTVLRARNARFPPMDDPSTLDDQPADEDIVRKAIAKAELKRLLDALRSEASPREREVFELHFVHGEAVHDVAELLGMSDNAVSAALLRLRKRLAGLVERLFPERKTKPPAPSTPGGSRNGSGSSNGHTNGATNGASKANGASKPKPSTPIDKVDFNPDDAPPPGEDEPGGSHDA